MKNPAKTDLIFGKNPIKEALATNRLKMVYVSEGLIDHTLIQTFKDKKIPMIYKSTGEMNKMVVGAHQGVIGEIKPYEYSSLEEIIHLGKKKENPIIVILDGITDPHNLGAIIRSCDVFGVSGIIVKKHNQVSLTSTVAKTSAGAINYVKVAQVTNLNNAVEQLKQAGYWVVSTDGYAKQDYTDLDYDFPCALIIGSEGEGVSKLLIKNSDYLVKIPMHGHVNSLNASVATAVLLSRIAAKK